ATLDSVNFYGALLGTVGGFSYGLREAYVDHMFGDNFKLTAGFFRNNFGMENMWSRYAMHSYHYSTAYGMAQLNGWNYDTGLRFTLMDLGPGDLEVSLFNSALNPGAAGKDTVGTAVRYSFDIDGGGWTLTPVVSTYLGRWQGGPRDIGASAGTM